MSGNGKTRAFVAVKVGETSWVADLPHGEVTVGRGDAVDMRVDVAELAEDQAKFTWNGSRLTLFVRDTPEPTFVNGKRVEGSVELKPGDEVAMGSAQLVVGMAVPPQAGGRRALTHHEFRERLYEEMARAVRGGRPTTLVMVQAKPQEGGKIATTALDSFRAGDVVGTYAHDELEFLLPDTPADTARAVVERILADSRATDPAAGIAVAPEHGDNPERLMRRARAALSVARERGTIELPPNRTSDFPPAEPALVDTASQEIAGELEQIANDVGSVLINGEPSAGKALFARMMHYQSSRKDGPLVIVECGSLEDEELTAQLQSDASPVKEAAGGTLILDGVGDLSRENQTHLVKALETASDVRVVATTHRLLGALVEREAFDADCYRRISTHSVELPPLRNRAEDIIPLAEKFAVAFGASEPVGMSAGALARLRSYPWPGNVLELRNAMERAVRLAQGGEILAEHLPSDVLPIASGEGKLREHVDSVERDAIVKALADTNHNQTHAAKRLGVSRRALIYKMEKYGLKPPPGASRR